MLCVTYVADDMTCGFVHVDGAQCKADFVTLLKCSVQKGYKSDPCGLVSRYILCLEC
jgi:hypothetical protein